MQKSEKTLCNTKQQLQTVPQWNNAVTVVLQTKEKKS